MLPHSQENPAIEDYESHQGKECCEHQVQVLLVDLAEMATIKLKLQVVIKLCFFFLNLSGNKPLHTKCFYKVQCYLSIHGVVRQFYVQFSI